MFYTHTHTHMHAPVVSCPLTLLLVLAGLLLQRPDGELDLFVAFASQIFFELALAAQQPHFLWMHKTHTLSVTSYTHTYRDWQYHTHIHVQMYRPSGPYWLTLNSKTTRPQRNFLPGSLS